MRCPPGDNSYILYCIDAEPTSMLGIIWQAFALRCLLLALSSPHLHGHVVSACQQAVCGKSADGKTVCPDACLSLLQLR